MHGNLANLILPYSTSAKDRVLPFTEEMEMAMMFYMAESDRKKGEGILRKKAPEKLVFIARSFYPVWLVPWNGKTLIFDGLNITRLLTSSEVLPDVKVFINDIQGSAEKRQAYSAALTDHAHYFEAVKKLEEIAILGLISSSDFVQDFQAYLMEAEEIDHSMARPETFLSSIIDEKTISSAVGELSEMKSTLESDIQDLREAMKLINTTTREHVEAMREETKKMQAEIDERIKVEKDSAMKQVRQIQEKYDAKILRTSEKFDKQLQELHQERVKLEKSKERVYAQIERCDSEIQASRARKVAATERRWKEEKDKWKKEVSALNRNTEDLSKQIQNTESQKKIETANLRSEFNAQSEGAMKDVRELEALKESKSQFAKQEIKSLEDTTSAILEQLDKWIKRKRVSMDQLTNLGIHEGRRKTALAYMPFYFSCFQLEAQRRYVIYPPSIARSMGAVTRIKGMLGASKAKSLYQQRSKAVTDILNQLTALIERDPVFKRDLHDIGSRADILKSQESREHIAKGLENLRNEEWISINEAQALSALLKSS